ncbi:ABC transporter substrate-binding protein [Methylobacterium nodulans]|uniref:Periplasmic binding protein n=1 Tax=Methylobacterium nodulans (strain LMG 21967 / CNCM I-2342 / ORS 2060) TaxID=460265 RepID=B8ILX8_METNO|nr:ABC transporter substrate-binding protein [Methylobacterium nodulans]ACL56322.1 periplasmic binding protein [Methylobacterium nodulans ORS 2060]
MRAAAIGGLAILAVAASPAHAEPISLKDALGRDVVLPAPPRRIVTIFSSNTELVAALGLADRIVGIDAFTRYPPEAAAKPVVGGRLGVSVDAVVAKAPDLVLVTPARQAAHQLLAPMERLGVPTLVLMSRSIGEVLDNLRLVGRATGEPQRGRAVAEALAARLAAVAGRIAGRPCRRLVLITGQLGNGLLLAAREGTYTGDALVRAGGCHALSGRGGLAQVSPEAVLAADPEVLLLAGRDEELRELTRRPGFREMRAVREGHAHGVARAEFLIPGPRTVDGIERLANLLHPPRKTEP